MLESIGERIKRLRKSLKLTQSQLGELIGKSKGNISGYENGTFDPSASTIIALAKCFNISTDELLLGRSSQNNSSLSKTERVLISKFNQLDDIKKERILERIDTYLEVHEAEKHNLYMVAESRIPSAYEASYIDKSKVTIKHIPILGQTAAGPPMDIIEVGGGDYVAVPETVDADYALFVKGDSMSPTIKDKDLVFIKSMPEVENGTVGVVDIDGTVTCKKVHRYNGRMELISFNKDYDPIIVDLSETPVRIIGKVVFCKNAESNFFTV